MIQNVLDFFGRFHPLIVHLPIGILLIAAVFQFLSWREGNTVLLQALKISVATGAVTAVVASATGYLLSRTADYDQDIVWWHQWLGIAVALISVAWAYLLNRNSSAIVLTITAGLLFVLIGITGHLGGTLTHGDDYLSFGPATDTQQLVPRKPIPNVQQAVAYTVIVQPILQNSCVGCHGEKKQKGKLRLDLPEHMMKGGKNGEVIDTTSLAESELIQRLMLPLSDKKHMPPKDKRQLTKDEISLLHWWVESGASFDRKVKELPQTGKIVSVITSLEKPPAIEAPTVELPEDVVAKAPQEALDNLRRRGVVVLPLSATSNYLLANFVSTENVTDKDISLLLPISKQLINLKLGNTKITDQALNDIGKCTNLRSLHLQHTAITDNGLITLNTLSKLQDINLVGTDVTAEGLMKLKNLKGLRNMYLYETGVARSSWRELQNAFPATSLDSGGYSLPVLEGDTMPVKPKPKAK